MKPFISNHTLFYPAKKVLDWIAYQPMNLILHYISGQSLKYLRSQQPVLVFSLPNYHYQNILSLLEKIQHKKKYKMIVYKHSFKIMIPKEELNLKQDFHFIIQKPFVYPHILISVDRLVYNYNQHKWSGDAKDLDDFYKGIIRLMKPEEIHLKHAISLLVYASLLDFTIEPSTLEKIRSANQKEDHRNIEISFLRNQFIKILTSAKPSQAFILMQKTGILPWFLPELSRTEGIKQNQNHKFDVFHHCIYSCDAIQKPELHLRLTGLFHGIGKAQKNRIQSNGKMIYMNHDVIGAKISLKVLRRFQFSQELIHRVYFLIRHHLFYYSSHWTEKAIRKFVKKVSPEDFNDLIQLRLADRKYPFSNSNLPLPPQIRKLLIFVERQKEQEKILKVKDLTLKGGDLQNLQIPPGPIYGKTLQYLLEKVKSQQIPNEREILLKEAIHFLSQEGYILKNNSIKE